jgi:hypothetical protein
MCFGIPVLKRIYRLERELKHRRKLEKFSKLNKIEKKKELF